MKILTLLEMPQFRDSLINFTMNANSYSTETLTREFDELVSDNFENSFGFWIHKQLSHAVVVVYKKDPNDESKIRAKIIVELDFKDELSISWESEPPKFRLPVIQVDGVSNNDPKYQNRGLTTELYNLLADRYVVVSDNIQYKGGRELWRKIAETTKLNGKSVIICDDSKIIRDDKDEIIRYNGGNFDAVEIWQPPDSKNNKFFCVLILTKDLEQLI